MQNALYIPSPHTPVDCVQGFVAKPTGAVVQAPSAASVHDADKLRPNEDAQAGVRAAEAVTISWSKRALIGAFAK